MDIKLKWSSQSKDGIIRINLGKYIYTRTSITWKASSIVAQSLIGHYYKTFNKNKNKFGPKCKSSLEKENQTNIHSLDFYLFLNKE